MPNKTTIGLVALTITLAFGAGYGLGLERGLGLGHQSPAVQTAATPALPAVALAQSQWVEPPYPFSEVPRSLESMARSLDSVSRTLEANCRQRP